MWKIDWICAGHERCWFAIMRDVWLFSSSYRTYYSTLILIDYLIGRLCIAEPSSFPFGRADPLPPPIGQAATSDMSRRHIQGTSLPNLLEAVIVPSSLGRASSAIGS